MKIVSFWKQFSAKQLKRIGIIMSLFFLAMSVFWILKPLRKSLFIGYFKDNPLNIFDLTLGGAQTEQLAKLSLVGIALAIALLFPIIVQRIPMRIVLILVCIVAVAGLGVSYFLITEPTGYFVWGFYVFGDFINALIITLLWMLLHNSVNTEEAKKLYSAVGIGTVAGGVFGAFFLYQGVSYLGRELIIAFCIFLIGLIGMLGFYIACRITDSTGKMRNCVVVYEQNQVNSDGKSNPLKFWQVKGIESYKYWIGIALLVGVYEISSGIIDFQLSVAVESLQATSFERDQYFGIIGQAQGVLALIVQIFVTGWVINRWGIGIALLILPFATMFGSVGFLLVPTLASAMFLSVSDNALNYSVNQSAKETLYVPNKSEERVAAKSIIDLFVQRFAKALAVILNLVLITQVSLQNVRWLSIIAIGLMMCWVCIALFTSREFEKRTEIEANLV
jgi:AAA family ATP:ADP antiporter